MNMAEYCNHLVYPQLVLLGLLLAVSTHHSVEQVQDLLEEDVLVNSCLLSSFTTRSLGPSIQGTSNTSFLVQLQVCPILR